MAAGMRGRDFPKFVCARASIDPRSLRQSFVLYRQWEAQWYPRCRVADVCVDVEIQVHGHKRVYSLESESVLTRMDHQSTDAST
jgi:hypothetical protein